MTKKQIKMIDRLIKKCRRLAKMAKKIEDEQYEGLVREGKWPKGLKRLGEN
jgi:preprotein translocase subunit Sss1